MNTDGREIENYDNFEEFYYPSVCHVCKIKNEFIKTCKHCKSYRYCSISHQKIHWPNHKKMCRVIQENMNELKNKLLKNKTKCFLQQRLQMKIALEQGLGRPLLPAENQVWMFPRACPVCYAKADVMLDCPACPSASYCSVQHQRQHKNVHSELCGFMALQYKIYCSRFNESNDIKLNRNITFQEMLTLFSMAEKGFPGVDDHLLRLAERLSHILTIIQALNICDVLHDFQILQNHLTIHIVGVTYESSNFNRLICELVFHWISNLKTLHLVFIGPELADQRVPEWEFCSSCEERDVGVHYDFEPSLYSNYCTSDRYRLPDIIVIFNCGFHELDNSEFDLWGESLPLLLIPNVPLVLTSYTHSEAIQDLNRIQNIFQDACSFDLLKKCEKNLFRSPIPLRDWVNTDEIYFNNYYFSILIKR